MRRKRMIRQNVSSYGGSSLYEITTKIAEDSEKLRMPVKTVTLSSSKHGYTDFYAAIVVFEEVKEND